MNTEHLELLKKLSQYNYLLEQLEQNFTSGFSNLTKANFHNKDSLRGKYGQDYYDLTYEGQLTVHIDPTKHSFYDIKRIAELRDPIKMFGQLSIPTSLRQCQDNFKKSINIIQELINCKNEIAVILDNVDRETKVSK